MLKHSHVLMQDVAVSKEDIAVLKQDMEYVKNNMITKDFWKEEKLRLLQGISKEMRKLMLEFFEQKAIQTIFS